MKPVQENVRAPRRGKTHGRGPSVDGPTNGDDGGSRRDVDGEVDVVVAVVASDVVFEVGEVIEYGDDTVSV
ncbi:MAG: hypothetical protein PF508_10365 [Spirochaeta sp.]|jgi:hypothetical protein|nr:hypothetical protein [Spirochaeta sp.]